MIKVEKETTHLSSKENRCGVEYEVTRRDSHAS